MNPLKEFAEDAQTIQIRKDPLLGDTSVFNPELKDKAQIFFGSCDQELIEKLVEDTAKSCFFCGDAVEKSTPRFTPDFSSEGQDQGRRGASLSQSLFARHLPPGDSSL